MDILKENKLSVIDTMLLIAFSAALAMMGFSFDLNSNPLVGDEASHALQALSLANDFDLKYDVSSGQNWVTCDLVNSASTNQLYMGVR